MPTWGEILKEINETPAPNGFPDLDRVRRRYLKDLHRVTGRAVILYASSWLETRSDLPADIQVGLADIQGLMEAISNLDESNLDLILHSPGGSAEAAESIVEY